MPKASRSVERAARQLVDLRDGQSCRRCGHSTFDKPSNVHPRRVAGGAHALVDRASNLIRLCGTTEAGCLGWVERKPADAETLGYLIPNLNLDLDPTEVPLFTFDGWVLLDDNGDLQSCAPPRREPA
jgi:hypothetical protein